MPVLSKKATNVERFDELDMTIPLGSGPYVISEAKAGARLVLRRDPDYWGRDIPSQRGLYNFDEIDLDYYRDGAALFEALKAGLLDYREETSAARWSSGYDFPAVRNGAVVKEVLRPGRPTGMEGFVFNLRKAIFRDVRLREAIAMMYDFEWINANFYGGLYNAHGKLLRRVGLFFGRASRKRGRARFAFEVSRRRARRHSRRPLATCSARRFGTRSHGREARADASRRRRLCPRRRTSPEEWRSRLFEIMIRDRDEERLALNFAASLKRIGIEANPRVYDEVQYQRRRQRFEYDMMIGQWLPAAVPGQEQLNRWSDGEPRSGKLAQSRRRRFAGARRRDRQSARVAHAARTAFAAARALDRLLLSGFYFVPLQHVNAIWCAHGAAIRHPAHMPLFPMFPFGFTLENWWSEKAGVR